MVTAESDAETDKDHLGLQEETTYEGLTDVDEAMVHSDVHISVVDTPMECSSGVLLP